MVLKRMIPAGMAAVMLLSACACTSGSKTGGAASGKKDMEGYEFRIAAWWDDTPTDSTPAGERKLKLKEQAEKDYNCKISYLYVPQGDIVQKLTASVMAGDPFADIVWLESNTAIPKLALSGYIAPADDYFDFSDSKWPSYGLKCNTFQGKHYGFVADIACTYGIWYNKNFFAEHKLPDLYELQQNKEWNWDKFAEISKAATTDTDNDGKNNTFGFAEIGWEPIVDRFIASNGQAIVAENKDGGYTYNIENADVKQAISYTVDLFQRGYKTEVEEFLAGNCAMFAGDGFWGDTFRLESDDEMGFVYFPMGPKASEYVCTTINANIMCIPTNSKRAEDAATIFEAITDWDNLENERREKFESWMYNEEDVNTCLDMFDRCQLHKWRAFDDLYGVFVEDIFWGCVKNNTTLEKAIAEHRAEGQSTIDSIMSLKNETK